MVSDCEECREAVELAIKYGGIDGGHHKSWVIDQMVKALMSSKEYVTMKKRLSEDGYEWDCGIAP